MALAESLFQLARDLVAFVLVVLLLLVATGLAVFLFRNPFDDLKFDREVWLARAGDRDPGNPRGQMAEDILERFRADPPTRDQVLQLLGPSEFPCSPLRALPGPVEACLSYNLGMWSGLGMDYDTLDVYFDLAGRFVSGLTVQH